MGLGETGSGREGEDERVGESSEKFEEERDKLMRKS